MAVSAALETPAHLGGYQEGGDPATWFPRLWRWCRDELAVTTMVDVGAGQGHAVQYFAMLGVEALGIEGVPQPDNPRLVEWDYTAGPWPAFLQLDAEGEWAPSRTFDLGWCCEFAEHVDAAHEGNWIATLAACRHVLMTHGEPGQDGHHHVNLHLAPYWVGRLEAVGLVWDEALTVHTRALAAVNPSGWNHYSRSGLAFRNPNLGATPWAPRTGDGL